MKNLLFITLLFLVGCQKEKYEHNNAALPSFIEFHIQTGCRTQVIIEDWGTGFENFPPNELIEMDAWRAYDNENMLSNRFIVNRLDEDGDWKYLGWGYVKQQTIITVDNLDKTVIKLN